MTQDAALSFEAAYARLEEILEKMNEGKVPLEEALKLYEEAHRLITWSNKQLADAEKKIEMLSKNREGDLLLDDQARPQTCEFVSANHAPLNRSV